MFQCNKHYLLILALLSFQINTLFTYAGQKCSVNPDNYSSKLVDEIVQLLEDCPPWSEITTRDDDNRGKILLYLRKISLHNPAAIRLAIQRYLGIEKSLNDSSGKWGIKESLDKYRNSNQLKPVSISRLSRIFVLNRYLFNVPSEAVLDRKTFGGWLDVPYREGKINWLWPLSVDTLGQLKLTGTLVGYVGPPYDALGEFDFFHRVYGRRLLLANEK